MAHKILLCYAWRSQTLKSESILQTGGPCVARILPDVLCTTVQALDKTRSRSDGIDEESSADAKYQS